MPSASTPSRSRVSLVRPPNWVAAAACLLLTVCGESPTSPRGGTERAVRLTFAPVMNQAERRIFSQVASRIDNVRLVLRNATGGVVLDTVIAFPPGQDSVVVAATIAIHGESERFGVRFELRAGTTTMFEGSQELVARAGANTTPPAAVPLVFIGPGARATRVTVTPANSTLRAGSTVTLTASVVDAAGSAINDAILAWSSSNEAIATVSSAGVVTALSVRGGTTITAQTLAGVGGSAAVTVTLPPSKIVVAGGASQSGPVMTTLGQPFAVQVQAADGVGVADVDVTFAAEASGALVSTVTAKSDGSGKASTSMTLGRTAGAQSFTASVAGLTAVSVTATATHAVASTIIVVSGDAQTDTTGRTLAAPFVVRVTDAYGNAAAGVNVGWRRVAGDGALSDATSVTNEAGEARVTYRLGSAPGTETVQATIAGSSTTGVTFTATARPRAAARVEYVSGSDQSGVVGTRVPQPLVVRVLDDLGNAVAGASVAWAITGGGELSAAATTSDAQGLAQVTATNPTTSGTYFVVARPAASTGTSVQFQMLALVGPPANLTIAAGDAQSAPIGVAVGVAPAVNVTDRYANPVTGLAVTFAPSSGGSVTGSPAMTNALGLAVLGSWTLGATAGSQTLVASAGGLTVTFTATATVPVGPPVLRVLQQPSATVLNTQTFATGPTVRLKTAGGALLKTAGVVVTVALKTTGPTLRGVLTATTDTAGVATFGTLSLKGTVGLHVLTFSASGYTGDTSATFKLIAGPAVTVTASSATALNGTAGSVVSPTPTVIVTDSSGNAVAGSAVTFALPSAANGSVAGGVVTTDTTGRSSPASWTLGTTVRSDTLTATAAGLVGSPVTFVATATAGAAAQLVKISGDAQTGVTGNPLAAPLVVEARDALNNPVTGVSIGFAAIAGGGSPSVAHVTTNGAGQAALTLTLGPPGADSVKACLPSCATAQVVFSALSIPVGADAIWTGTTSAVWSTAANWSPAVVPGSANKVFIPAGTANSPGLTGDIALAELTLAPGATLALGAQAISLSGGVLATGASMTGTGYLNFCGGTHTVAGGLAGVLVDCGATVTPSGAATVAGWLETRNGSVFDAGTAATTVTGDARMYSGSRIRMTQAGAHLIVNGTYDSNPGGDVGDAWMTDGVLELKGNLAATNSCCSQSFRAVGAHVTRFSGSAAQSVNFYYTDNWSRSTFGNVEFTGGNTVTLVNNMRVHGTVTVTGATKVAGGTVYHGGQLTTSAASDLSGLGYTQLNGGGAVFPLIAGVGPGEMQIAGAMTVTLPQAAVTLPTNLTTHSGAVLDLENKVLAVTGNYGMYSGSRVKMITAAARFTVNGTYDSNPGGDVGDTWMTDGVLELKGNLTATNSCCSQSFRAVGAHVTRFSGSAAQSVNFYYTDNWSRSTFGNVEFTGGNTVTLVNNMRVHGTVTVTGATKVAGGTVYHGGQLTTSAASDLSGLGYTQLNGGGAVFPLIAGVGPGEMQIAGAMTVTLPQAAVTLPTNLTTHSGAVLDLENKVLAVTGNYGMYSGSRVKMAMASALFTVGGNADFNPGGDIGDTWFTAGTLDLKGNFSATNSCCGQSFRATGTHLTRFSGTGAQGIAVYYPSSSQTAFMNVEITNASASGVATSGGVHVLGGFTNLGRFTINTGHFLTIGGAMTLGASSITSNAGSLSKATCSAASGAVFSGFSCP